MKPYYKVNRIITASPRERDEEYRLICSLSETQVSRKNIYIVLTMGEHQKFYKIGYLTISMTMIYQVPIITIVATKHIF